MRKIVLFLMPILCIFAGFLSLMGVESVSLGTQYYNFLNVVSQRFNDWKIEIPTIPSLESSTSNNDFFDAIITFVNFIITIINVIIIVLNTIIFCIQFICTLLFCILDLANILRDSNLPVNV